MNTNRLSREKSPYLLQHAHNPVDWYPWGEEAFRKAKSENKPIFLSIGYSTCHWCHVMEEESFVNIEIAKILNEHFVSVKVDREERPDVDQVFMQVVMAMTGSGGWPMSIFLTPDLKPFYGGTYFPPTDKWGRPGFPTLLNAIHQKWISEHDRVLKSSQDIERALAEELARKSRAGQTTLNEQTLKLVFERLEAQYDSNKGGFSQAPKFPQGHVLSLLLRYWKRTGNEDALAMVEQTLEEMAKGGMYDQLGGGFHRYSTDAEWRIPHFEKMLYDQAILAKAYLEAYQATKKELFARVARETLNYVLHDLTDREGGFYSAEDADSAVDPAFPNKKSEGAFYIWSVEEIEKHLGKEDTQIFNFYFGLLPEGNAIQDPHQEFNRKNVLFLEHSAEETAKRFRKSPEEVTNLIERSKKKLLEARNRRPRPHLDDKVLTDWNGLMISALAFGSRVLSQPGYLAAAKKAADFLIDRLKVNGRLMHRYREGHVFIPAFQEDYAFLINGLIDLYEVSFEQRYLDEARFLIQEMIRLFWDEKDGGFFLSGNDAEKYINPGKEAYDGAVPSGNSVAALALLKFSRLAMETKLTEYAEKTFQAFSSQIASYPSAYAQMLIALDFTLGPSKEIVVSGKQGSAEIEKMMAEIYSRFLPNKVVAHQSAVPFLSAISGNGKTAVYVCQNFVCQLPVTEIERLKDALEG